MAGQPFHRMAPVPPHLSYRPEISTYMDHFRKPQPALRRTRPLLPPQQFMMRSRSQQSGDLRKKNLPLTSSAFKQQMRRARAKTTVKDYMDARLNVTDNSFPAYNARVDIPYKSAQPNQAQRCDLKRIARTGFGISDTEARDLARADRSLDFYHQHKLAANSPVPVRSVRSAPPHHPMPPPTGRASPTMRPSAKIIQNDRHWMSWDSGTPEPPGLQKRLHRPYPTPEPPVILDSYRPSSRPSRCNSANVPRPASGTLLPTNPCNPVPDRIGSEGTNPTLLKDTERAFTPQVTTLPANETSRKVGYPVACLM